MLWPLEQPPGTCSAPALSRPPTLQRSPSLLDACPSGTGTVTGRQPVKKHRGACLALTNQDGHRRLNAVAGKVISEETAQAGGRGKLG